MFAHAHLGIRRDTQAAKKSLARDVDFIRSTVTHTELIVTFGEWLEGVSILGEITSFSQRRLPSRNMRRFET